MRALRLLAVNRFAGTVITIALTCGLGTYAAAPASATETTGCTFATGWYKSHAGTVDLFIQPDIPTYLSVRRPLTFMSLRLNMTWQQILDAPAQGNAELIAAKQMIAAAMNVERNDGFIPESIAEAYIAVWNHYEDSTQYPLTRAQLTANASILAAYNEGALGSPPC